MLCLNFVKTKFRLAFPLLLLRWSRKICRVQLRIMHSECSRFHPNRFTFGGIIAERVHTVETRDKVFPIFGWSITSSRIISIYCIIDASSHLHSSDDNFWVTFCKTVGPILSDRCLSVLSVCPLLSVLSVSLVYCGQRLDGSRCHLAWR